MISMEMSKYNFEHFIMIRSTNSMEKYCLVAACRSKIFHLCATGREAEKYKTTSIDTNDMENNERIE